MVKQSHGIGAPTKSSNGHKDSALFSLDDLGELVVDGGKMIWNVFFQQEQPELLVVDEIDDSTIDESILSAFPSDLEDCNDKEEDREAVIPQQSLSSDVGDDGQERDRYAVNYCSLASFKDDGKSWTMKETVHRKTSVKDKVPVAEPILPHESKLVKDNVPASKPILPNESNLVKNNVPVSEPILPNKSNLAKDNVPASEPILPNESNLVKDKVAASEPVLAKADSRSIASPSTPTEVHDVETRLAMGMSCDQSTEKEDYQNAYLAMCSPLVSALSNDSDYVDAQNKSLSEINDVVERTPTDFVPQERDSMAHSAPSKSAKRTLNPFSLVTRLKKREPVAVERNYIHQETATTLFVDSLLKATLERPPKSQTKAVDRKLKQKQKQKENAVTLFTPPEKRGRKKSNLTTEPRTSGGKGIIQSPKLFRKLLQPYTTKDTVRNEGREEGQDGVEESRVIPSQWVAFEKRE